MPYKLGLNHLADWTEEEKEKILGYKGPSGSSTRGLATSFLGIIFYVIQTAAGTIKRGTCPSVTTDGKTVDLRYTPCWGKVLDQGQCGSCYAFCACQVLEHLYCLKCGGSFPLDSSEQNIVDCSGPQGNQGCNGGLMDNVFAYIQQSKGMDMETSYPYTAVQETCKFDASTAKYKEVTGYTSLPPCETEMKKHLDSGRSLCCAIKVAGNFTLYTDGVYGDKRTCPTNQGQLNHAIVVTGYGTDSKGGEYWLVKNSWSEKWGDAGYFKIKMGCNCLGIAFMCGYPEFNCDKV